MYGISMVIGSWNQQKIQIIHRQITRPKYLVLHFDRFLNTCTHTANLIIFYISFFVLTSKLKKCKIVCTLLHWILILLIFYILCLLCVIHERMCGLRSKCTVCVTFYTQSLDVCFYALYIFAEKNSKSEMTRCLVCY